MFDPETHKNQHYVPVFWQERFRGPGNVLHRKKRGRIEAANPNKEMSADWLYTIFDDKGFPSNILEFGSSKIEANAAAAFRSLDTPGSVGTLEEQIFLRWFIAFSACRHPDTMSMGHRRAKDLAYVLADVHSKSLKEFIDSLSHFGLDAEEATLAYAKCRCLSAEDLLAQAEMIEHMSPTDSALPQQIALSSETIEQVFFKLCHHNVTILDAPAGSTFVLGDTPFAVDLAKGFVVPISSTIALLWAPGSKEALPDWTRRTATPTEVQTSNRQQIENCLTTVIGPSRASLT